MIDSRLLDCAGEPEITENFNRIIKSMIFEVTFDSDGGSAVNSQYVRYGNKAIKPSDPTKTGKTFSKWQLNSTDFNFSSAITNHITLKAIWV